MIRFSSIKTIKAIKTIMTTTVAFAIVAIVAMAATCMLFPIPISAHGHGVGNSFSVAGSTFSIPKTSTIPSTVQSIPNFSTKRRSPWTLHGISSKSTTAASIASMASSASMKSVELDFYYKRSPFPALTAQSVQSAHISKFQLAFVSHHPTAYQSHQSHNSYNIQKPRLGQLQHDDKPRALTSNFSGDVSRNFRVCCKINAKSARHTATATRTATTATTSLFANSGNNNENQKSNDEECSLQELYMEVQQEDSEWYYQTVSKLLGEAELDIAELECDSGSDKGGSVGEVNGADGATVADGADGIDPASKADDGGEKRNEKEPQSQDGAESAASTMTNADNEGKLNRDSNGADTEIPKGGRGEKKSLQGKLAEDSTWDGDRNELRDRGSDRYRDPSGLRQRESLERINSRGSTLDNYPPNRNRDVKQMDYDDYRGDDYDDQDDIDEEDYYDYYDEYESDVDGANYPRDDDNAVMPEMQLRQERRFRYQQSDTSYTRSSTSPEASAASVTSVAPLPLNSEPETKRAATSQSASTDTLPPQNAANASSTSFIAPTPEPKSPDETPPMAQMVQMIRIRNTRTNQSETIAPLPRLVKLGYSSEEILKLRPQVLELIVEDGIQRPRRGVPLRWMREERVNDGVKEEEEEEEIMYDLDYGWIVEIVPFESKDGSMEDDSVSEPSEKELVDKDDEVNEFSGDEDLNQLQKPSNSAPLQTKVSQKKDSTDMNTTSKLTENAVESKDSVENISTEVEEESWGPFSSSRITKERRKEDSTSVSTSTSAATSVKDEGFDTPNNVKDMERDRPAVPEDKGEELAGEFDDVERKESSMYNSQNYYDGYDEEYTDDAQRRQSRTRQGQPQQQRTRREQRNEPLESNMTPPSRRSYYDDYDRPQRYDEYPDRREANPYSRRQRPPQPSPNRRRSRQRDLQIDRGTYSSSDNDRRNRNDPNDPPPNKFWMDLPTFRDFLRREAQFRLQILGPDWKESVLDESRWRFDLYKRWLYLLDEGVGENPLYVYGERERPRSPRRPRQRMQETRERERRPRQETLDRERRPQERRQRVQRGSERPLWEVDSPRQSQPRQRVPRGQREERAESEDRTQRQRMGRSQSLQQSQQMGQPGRPIQPPQRVSERNDVDEREERRERRRASPSPEDVDGVDCADGDVDGDYDDPDYPPPPRRQPPQRQARQPRQPRQRPSENTQNEPSIQGERMEGARPKMEDQFDDDDYDDYIGNGEYDRYEEHGEYEEPRRQKTRVRASRDQRGARGIDQEQLDQPRRRNNLPPQQRPPRPNTSWRNFSDLEQSLQRSAQSEDERLY